mgnify:CR=1 FL=1
MLGLEGGSWSASDCQQAQCCNQLMHFRAKCCIHRSLPTLPPDFLTDGAAGVGMEYDAVSQQCQPCAAGTARNDTLVACVAW